MRAVVHSTGSGWQQRYQEFFCEGLNAHGISVGLTRTTDVKPADFHVIFANNSWNKTIHECKVKGIPVMTVNRCFFGNRHDNVAIGWDGFNGRADFMNKGSSGDRWEKHGVRVDPWRTNQEGYVLVLGEFRDMTDWYTKVFNELKGCPLETRFRPHPFKSGQTVCGWRLAPGKPQDDIKTALKQAAICVSYDTIGGVDAAIAGVPTVSYGDFSMARPVSMPKITDAFYPIDRLPWLQDLAYAQWHYTEIIDGSFWRHLGARVADTEATA